MEKINELRTKEPKDLLESLKESKREQMNLRFQKANDVLESSRRIRIIRRQIARIKTVMNEKRNKDKY